MSWSIFLSIDGPVPLDALSREVGDFLSISFKEAKDEKGEIYYEFDDKRYCDVTLERNFGLVNDRNMNFEDFAYVMAIRARTVSDWETAHEACLELGRTAFERLKGSRRYKLMLTCNLGKKLDSFSPE